MRVLLISSNVAEAPYPVYPLGMSMIAAAVKADGHEVTCFDFFQNMMSLTALAERIEREKPDVLGLSIRNIDNVNLMNEERYLEKIGEIVNCAHRTSSAKVVLGGTAFSIFPEEIMKKSGADYGVVGEGEELFRKILKDGETGHWPDGGTIFRSEPHLEGRSIPSAAYDDQLLSFYLQKGGLAALQTKRGCPLRCAYCSYPSLEGSRLRSRDPVQVADDMEYLAANHRVDSIFFTDSVFNDDSGLYLEVIKEINRRQLRIPWSAFFKPSGINPEIVELLKNSGLRSVEMGSDAATDTTLAGQRKSFNWTEVVQANDQFMKAGIPTAHYFMFGGPDETPETVKRGIENICDLSCTMAFVFMGVRILPDTWIRELAVRENIIGPQESLLDPVYYISPALERNWLEQTLQEAFNDSRRIMFPPDRFDDRLRKLHELGWTGALWDLLGPQVR